MKTLLCIISIFIFSVSAFTQLSNTYYGFEEVYELGPGWGFYSNNYLNGPSTAMGNTGIASLENGTAGIQLNPASLNIKNRFEVSTQFNYKLNMRESYITPLFDNVNNKYSELFPSGSISLGYKATKYLSLGAFYSNPGSFSNIWGKDIYILANGNSLTTDLTRSFSIHTVGIPIVLTYKRINLGVSLEYSNYRTDINGLPPSTSNPNESSSAYAKANSFNVRFGFTACLTNEFYIGGTLTPPFSLDYKSTLPHISTEYLGLPQYPLIIGAGIQYTWSNIPLRFCFDYSFTEKSGNYVFSKNVSNYNIGAEYAINKKFKLRTGFFTNNSNDIYASDYNQVFLTAGLGYEYRKYLIDIAVLDSHISTGIIKNTIIQTSLAYSF